MALQPYKGANTAQFYVLETTPGVTPTSPSWSPLRNTGGIPAVTRDALVSNELDGSRETSSIRTGNKQVTGEYAIELSAQSQDELLAGAMTSSWVAGSTVAGLSVTVDADAKTFTRAAGDFTTAVEVGDLVRFPGLTGDNRKPFIVTAVSALVVTGGAINHTLTDESAVTSDLVIADKLETGNLCKTYSILTWFKGRCGGADSYVITRGVEFTGFTIEQAVNAMVTGSFPFIGLNQEILSAPPAGSTFTANFNAQPFASVDVSAFNGTAPLKLIDTFTITNDNGTSAQFELGNDSVAFVERGRAANTFSLAGKLYDMTLLNLFLNETQIELTSILAGPDGAMSFTLKRAELTSATPEIGGPESVTLSMEGQATGNQMQSSIVIQRIAYA
ncbi:putative tail protein [Salmonella phage St162]|uniref:Putative tail protein n=1 Tax=Salmonella phage St162 TaxID=2024312 RepID=A0A291AX88_9CAUD|nr:putative tail protein [Salmonella phage St162]ATE85637.1 putative tail protein [Salmonella phage St162]